MLKPSEIREQITDQIIEALTNGKLPPWRKPWSNDPNAPGLHTSLSTGQAYRGINQLILQIAASRQNFQSKWWGTFNQIKACGACVRRREKATRVVLWKPINRKRTNDDGEEVEDNFLVMREFCVFNAEQAEGLPQYQVGFARPQTNNSERFEEADAVIAATNADIRYGGNEAFYRQGGDFIQMPHRQQFESLESFYQTLSHELVHWTEHPTRLNWNRPDEGYAMGELIAEIGGCFMMGELGLPTTESLENHAAYLKHWLKGLNGDSKFIFKAAAQATKAVEFVLSFSRVSAPAAEPVLEDVTF